MRKLVLVIAVIIVMAAFAGCLGGDAEKKKDNNSSNLILKHATTPTQSGWIENDGSDHASAPITVALNDTNIVSVKFTIKVDDSNPANSETDEGSNPDDVIVSILSGNETEKKSGPTPLSATIEFTAPGGTEAPEYLDQSWIVQIDADLNGGKPIFIGIIWTYVDQGVAYKVDCEYSYMVLEETTGI